MLGGSHLNRNGQSNMALDGTQSIQRTAAAPISFCTAVIQPAKVGLPAVTVHVTVHSDCFFVVVSQTGTLGAMNRINGPLVNAVKNMKTNPQNSNQQLSIIDHNETAYGFAGKNTVPILIPKQILGAHSTFMDLFSVCIAEDLGIIPEDPTMLLDPSLEIPIDADGSCFEDVSFTPLEEEGSLETESNIPKNPLENKPFNLDKSLILSLALVDQPSGDDPVSEELDLVLKSVRKWIKMERIAFIKPLSAVPITN